MNEEQKDFFDLLNKEIQNNHISHSYLIETGDYKNIDYIINRMCKMILCPNKNIYDSCNECTICNLIDNNNYPDIKILEDNGSFIKKEQLIEVQEQFSKKSIYDNKQIYVIKDASKLNTSSGNTILKFLEEPNENIIAILFTNNRYNVLETIVSRCQILRLDDNIDFNLENETIEIIETLFKNNKAFLAYNDIISILTDKNVFFNELDKIEKYFIRVINKKIELYENINHLSDKNIYDIIMIIEKYLKRCEFNVNYKLMLDSFIVEINSI